MSPRRALRDKMRFYDRHVVTPSHNILMPLFIRRCHFSAAAAIIFAMLFRLTPLTRCFAAAPLLCAITMLYAIISPLC